MALDAVQEEAVLKALAAEWREIDEARFRRALRIPAFRLVDGTSQLGQWDRRAREIRISREFVARAPWGSVVEVLKHEVAHQYCHEVLGAVDEAAHGPAFQQTCARLGFDGAAAGVPGDPDPARSRIMEKVKKLLALAGSENRNEAELAMATAQRLMLEHNIATVPLGYVFQHLGAPSGRTPAHAKDLSSLLQQHFFVEVLWVRTFDVARGAWGQVLEVCGTPENVAMAAYVHAWLLRTAEALWKAHRRAEGLTSDRDRRAFLAGVVRGFSEKLAEGSRRAEATGLTWVGDPGARRFFRSRHPRIRTTYYRAAGGQAHAAGKARGREIVLHRPVTGRGEGGGFLSG